MCGRYALSLTSAQVRQRLANQHMPADEAPHDDDDRIRQTYNFAPGYHGLVYRAQIPDRHNDQDDESENAEETSGRPSKRTKLSHGFSQTDGRATAETKYKLQAMKWGLIPFWTKRPPDYGSQMKTINCRDDSLIENRGMWNTMKQRKRCVVVAEGFYEWLKKNNGKEKIPHFIKRKDGQLMIMAGLWDMVVYEGSEEKLYTYTIITTDSNKQLKFLHDRMPVILEAGSKTMEEWLDPNNIGWSKELQRSLKPFEGELECYQVDKAVGKVGNNSPSFVVPIDSKENKNNIAHFFGTQRATAQDVAAKNGAVERDANENRDTSMNVGSTEDNAPLPKPKNDSDEDFARRVEHDTTNSNDEHLRNTTRLGSERAIKRELSEVNDTDLIKAAESPMTNTKVSSPAKNISDTSSSVARKTRSATKNNTITKSPAKEGNAKITKFFGK